MKYAIVYSSQTGNTRLLAETVQGALPQEECVYFGTPCEKALEADRIYVGFWTDREHCDELTAGFLKTVSGKEIFLFGTAGFGHPRYFESILDKTQALLPSDSSVIGRFMCQGKMQMSVRQKYEKMQKEGSRIPNIEKMISNFDQALSHPDQEDLEQLKKAVLG